MMTETMRNHRSLDFMGFPNYVIYVDGKVMNWTTGRILKPANNGTGLSVCELASQWVRKANHRSSYCFPCVHS